MKRIDVATIEFDSEIAAYHEAAHAVVAQALGLGVARIAWLDRDRATAMTYADRILGRPGETLAYTLAGYFQERSLLVDRSSARDGARGDLCSIPQIKEMFEMFPSNISHYGSWWRFYLHWARISREILFEEQDVVEAISTEFAQKTELNGRGLSRLLRGVRPLSYEEYMPRPAAGAS